MLQESTLSQLSFRSMQSRYAAYFFAMHKVILNNAGLNHNFIEADTNKG